MRMPRSCSGPGEPGAAGAVGGGAQSDVGALVTDPPANELAASFDWLRTPVGTPPADCLPGRCEGGFDGGYQAPLAFNTPIPVFAADFSGKPGLMFDLLSDGTGEFLTVQDGKMDGVADGLFPFTAEISSGQLDCTTGVFRAKLVQGMYVVGVFPCAFEGDIVARYDPPSRSFVDGRWAVMENGDVPPPIEPAQEPPLVEPGKSGGTETWSTTWIR